MGDISQNTHATPHQTGAQRRASYLAYLAYLRSGHWSLLKSRLACRAGNRCETCHHTGEVWPLDGHHLIYRSPLTSGTVDDLMYLCRRCHDIAHDLKIDVLFSLGTPVEVRRERTLAEIHDYLKNLALTRNQGKPFRIYLKQKPRKAIVGKPRRSKRKANRNRGWKLVAANNELRERQRHLPRN